VCTVSYLCNTLKLIYISSTRGRGNSSITKRPDAQWSGHSLTKARALFAERCGGVCGGAKEPTPVPDTPSSTRTLPTVARPLVAAPTLALTAEHLEPTLGQPHSPSALIRGWLIDVRNDDSASVAGDVENEWEIRDWMDGAQRYYYFTHGCLFFNWYVANVFLPVHTLTCTRISAERLNLRGYVNEDRPPLATCDVLDDAIFQAFGMRFRRGKHRLKVRAWEGSLLVKSFWCNTECVPLLIRLCLHTLTLHTGMSASSSSTASTLIWSLTSRRSRIPPMRVLLTTHQRSPMESSWQGWRRFRRGCRHVVGIGNYFTYMRVL
jgi:hypothetical protein